jgi:hypothetical protein
MAKTKKVTTDVVAAEKEEKIVIPPIQKKTALITLVGTTPLMVNNFSTKSKTEMLEKQMKKAKGAKESRNIEKEVEAALYRLSGKNRYGMPASGLKNCAVSACRFIEGVPMTRAKGSFFVLEDENGLVEIKSKKGYTVDERPVSIGKFGNKTKMIRFRPRFDDWSCTFKVVYNPNIISAEQLLNLYENAGFSVGLCEFRPEKSGNLGMFEVKRG